MKRFIRPVPPGSSPGARPRSFAESSFTFPASFRGVLVGASFGGLTNGPIPMSYLCPRCSSVPSLFAKRFCGSYPLVSSGLPGRPLSVYFFTQMLAFPLGLRPSAEYVISYSLVRLVSTGGGRGGSSRLLGLFSRPLHSDMRWCGFRPTLGAHS